MTAKNHVNRNRKKGCLFHCWVQHGQLDIVKNPGLRSLADYRKCQHRHHILSFFTFEINEIVIIEAYDYSLHALTLLLKMTNVTLGHAFTECLLHLILALFVQQSIEHLMHQIQL